MIALDGHMMMVFDFGFVASHLPVELVCQPVSALNAMCMSRAAIYLLKAPMLTCTQLLMN